MTRLFIDSTLKKNLEIKLTQKTHHYLNNVMRKKIGDDIYLINGTDGEWISKIQKITKKETVLKITKQTKELYKPPFLNLTFTPIQKIDLLCKNAIELGVTQLQPIQTEYTQSKLKLTRIEANIKEAIEQSERTDFPQIKKTIKLKDFLNNIKKEDTVIFCEERTGDNKTFNILKKLKEQKKLLKNSKYYILIGPEGGFSKNEKQFIKQNKSTFSVNLGPRILRTETAVSSILSLVQCFLGDW